MSPPEICGLTTIAHTDIQLQGVRPRPVTWPLNSGSEHDATNERLLNRTLHQLHHGIGQHQPCPGLALGCITGVGNNPQQLLILCRSQDNIRYGNDNSVKSIDHFT